MDKTVQATAQRLLDRKLSNEDGIQEQAIQAAESRLGMRLPKALRDFYAYIGNLEIFRSSVVCFTNLEDLEIIDGKMIFLVDNQGTCYWALGEDDWERGYLRFYDQQEWYRDFPIDEFIYIMLHVQCVFGGYKHVGVVNVDDFENVNEFLEFQKDVVRGWTLVVDDSGFVIYIKDTKLIAFFYGTTWKKDDTIYAAALNGNGMKELQKYGFAKIKT